MYTSTLNFTARFGGWPLSCPGHFTPCKEHRYTLPRMLGGPWGQSRQMCKISQLPGFKLWTIQPVASCYTNCSILAVNIWFSDSFQTTQRKQMCKAASGIICHLILLERWAISQYKIKTQWCDPENIYWKLFNMIQLITTASLYKFRMMRLHKLFLIQPTTVCLIVQWDLHPLVEPQI